MSKKEKKASQAQQEQEQLNPEQVQSEETNIPPEAPEPPPVEELDTLKASLAAQEDKFLRLAAEYDNYRKRTQKEKEGTYQEAKIDTIVKFLEIYDNLERAANQEGDEDNVHKKGMVMIFHQFQGVLEKLGITEIDPMGEAFDTERHNAVLHIEDENLGESVVSQVFQKGFLLGNRVIRFATVQVAN